MIFTLSHVRSATTASKSDDETPTTQKSTARGEKVEQLTDDEVTESLSTAEENSDNDDDDKDRSEISIKHGGDLPSTVGASGDGGVPVVKTDAKTTVPDDNVCSNILLVSELDFTPLV